MSEIRRNIDLSSVVPLSANITVRWARALLAALHGFAVLLSFSDFAVSVFWESNSSYCSKDMSYVWDSYVDVITAAAAAVGS